MVNHYFKFLRNSLLLRTINLLLVFFVLQAGVLFYVMFWNQRELINASYNYDLSTMNLYLTNQLRVNQLMAEKLKDIEPQTIYQEFVEKGLAMTLNKSHTNILIVKDNMVLFNNSTSSISDYSTYLINLNPLLLYDLNTLDDHIQKINSLESQVYTLDYLSNQLLPYKALHYYRFEDLFVVLILDVHHFLNSKALILETGSDEDYNFSDTLKEVALYDSKGMLTFHHILNPSPIDSFFELVLTKRANFFFLGETQVIDFKYDQFQFINRYSAILIKQVLFILVLISGLIYLYKKKDDSLYLSTKKTLQAIENAHFEALGYLENKSLWTENHQLVQAFNRLVIESKRQFINFSDNEAKLEKKRMMLKEQEMNLEGLIEGLQQTNSRLKSVLKTNEQDYFTMLNVMANAIEAKDDYTRGHCDRVMEVSLSIGVRLGLSANQLKNLRYGATLHDIGKIGIHESVLNKPDQLSDKERLLIEQHPVIGDVIISELDYLDESKAIILYHHERFDGNGYPKGLSGNDIPKLARIVCIADAYDAMTSIRPYRNTVMSQKDVLRELQRCSGKQFDPELVTILCQLIQEGGVK